MPLLLTTARLTKRWVFLGAFLLLALGASTAARAQAEDEKALELFAAGRYEEALELSAKLYAKTRKPIHLHNIGRCHQRMGKPDDALASFRDYLDKAENLDPKKRAQVQRYIEEMEALKRERARAAAAAERQASPPAPAITTPPAPPSVTTAPAPPPSSDALDLSAKADEAPGAPPVYQRWWFWTGAAVVVAGVVVTAVLLSIDREPLVGSLGVADAHEKVQ